MIIRLLDRVKGDATVQDGGSDADVVTTQIASPEAALASPEAVPPVVIPKPTAPVVTPAQLELSTSTGANGYQVVSVAGELDIATAEQAYSFIAEVIDGLRRSLAAQYLHESSFTLAQIGWLLGYQGATSFHHAFRRWTGHSPSLARSDRRLLAPG